MKKYGLIGHPLGHSFSAAFFADKFAKERINARYDNYDLADTDAVEQFVVDFPRSGGCGFNVTIPYKQKIIPHLAKLSEEASEIGAVNVVKVVGTELHGYNSDVIGFRESIRPLLQPWHTKAYVLGATGGASKAVIYALQKLGLKVIKVSRHATNDTINYEQFETKDCRDVVIINCTPLGMHPNIESCPTVPYNTVSERTLLYDLVYNPLETTFLRQGREHGAITKNGLEMLHLQAIAAWEIWNNNE